MNDPSSPSNTERIRPLLASLSVLVVSLVSAGCGPDCGGLDKLAVMPAPLEAVQAVSGGVICSGRGHVFIVHRHGDGVSDLVARYQGETSLEVVDIDDTMVSGLSSDGPAQLLLGSDEQLFELRFEVDGGRDLIEIQVSDRSDERLTTQMRELATAAQVDAQSIRAASKGGTASTCDFGPSADVLLFTEIELGVLANGLSRPALGIYLPVMRALLDAPIVAVESTSQRTGPQLRQNDFRGGVIEGHVTFFDAERKLLCRRPWAASSSGSVEVAGVPGSSGRDREAHGQAALAPDLAQARRDQLRALVGHGPQFRLRFAADLEDRD